MVVIASIKFQTFNMSDIAAIALFASSDFNFPAQFSCFQSIHLIKKLEQ